MFKKYLYKATILLVLFSLAISAAGVNTTPARAASTIYVDINAFGANDGSSWTDAYFTLQDALAAAASGDQIWVADGVYYPDAGVGQVNDDRMSTFQLVNGVEIYGGFAGTESLLSERNISANVTILSGDLEHNDINGDSNFIAETTVDIVGNNAYHVVRGGDATATTILDGFTITAGNADGVTFDTQNGGGLFNWSTNPTLQNVIFSGNNAEETNSGGGGGVYNYNVSTPAQFTNVTFTGNNAYSGGGMSGDPDIVVTDSTFINNTASNTGGGLDITGNGGVLTNVSFTNNTAVGGGGMSITLGNPTLTNVTFSNNTADSAGAVNVYQSNPEFINVSFINNTATDFYGGAVQLTQSSPIFRNVTFNNNSANNNGGALFSSTSSDPTLVNVTFTNNSAVTSGGGMYTGGSSDATLTNVTFSNNSATSAGGLLALNGTVTLQNTIIANSTGGDCVTSSATFDGAGHNLIESTGTDACNLVNGVNGNIIGSDPILGTLNGSPAYFPLISGSPAIDSGDDAICAAAPVYNESQNGVTRPSSDHCDIGSFEKAQTFEDVPFDGFAWAQIEAIYIAGITGGCGGGNYCPNNKVTRAQMAVFLLRGIHGSSYTPPAATGTMFTDVPASLSTAAWIEQLAIEGITSGCSGGNYCPNASVTREQMAIFLLRAKYTSAYTPPAATGTIFIDVPLGSFADAWIEQLVAEGITSGCGGGNYCPANPVTRAQMAIFLQRTFSLPLP